MYEVTKTVYFTKYDIHRNLNWEDIHACDKINCGMIEQVTESLIAWHSIKPKDLLKVILFIRDYFKLYSYEVDTYLTSDTSELHIDTSEYISENNQIIFIGSHK